MRHGIDDGCAASATRSAVGTLMLAVVLVAACGDDESGSGGAGTAGGTGTTSTATIGSASSGSQAGGDAASSTGENSSSGGDGGSDASGGSGGGGSGGDGGEGGGAPVAGCLPGDLDLEPYRSDTCACGDDCDCFLDIPYGEAAAWSEGQRDFVQAFDLFVPKDAAPDASLVVWAHPNGSTKTIDANGPLTNAVVRPLIEAGGVFVSVEFRHPANDDTLGVAPTDIAVAVQTMRCHASDLGIDPARIGLIGRSRGTLSVWTAVQDDLADPDAIDPVARQSSRVLGVWAVNAQTSYWGPFIAETYFDEESYDAIIAEQGTENYGHAVGDATVDDPPIHFVYDSELAELPLHYTDCSTLGGDVDCVHLANFGDVFCDAYDAAGNDGCVLETGLDGSDLYDGALPFFAALAD